MTGDTSDKKVKMSVRGDEEYVGVSSIISGWSLYQYWHNYYWCHDNYSHSSLLFLLAMILIAADTVAGSPMFLADTILYCFQKTCIQNGA